MRTLGGGWPVVLLCGTLLAPFLAAADPIVPGINPAARHDRGHALPRQAPAPAVNRSSPALIAIILDDLGDQYAAGLRAVNLPGAVACAFLPETPHSAVQAQLAYRRGKEVLLHLPLQPGNASKRYPTALGLNSNRAEIGAYLQTALASVPYARGVNNHQGSLLTEMPQHMDWLMSEIKLHSGLYFVDSRTSGHSIAYRVARAKRVPSAERQVFLDAERGEAAVRSAFRQLVQRARRDEHALAIGHPYPETFKVLEEELPRLAQYGVKLVAPSELIASQNGERRPDEPYYKQLKLSPALALATTVSSHAAGTAAAP